MSDLTNLSYQYLRRADFAQQVNDAVLELKRQKSTNTQKLTKGSVDFLVSALTYLISRLNEDRPEGEKVVPEEIVHDLSAQIGDGDQLFKDDLAVALKALQGSNFGGDHWRTLERLCTVADRTASASYRRLRRR